jgi:cation transport regulator ChaC
MDDAATHLPYFSYGSNLVPEHMAEFCPGHRVLGRARLEGWTMRFRGQGDEYWTGAVATVEPAPGGRVEGVLYALTAEHYTAIDAYEDYRGPGRTDGMYDRIRVTVRAADGRDVEALTYVMHPAPEALPSRAYLAAIARGARHHGLPEDYVRRLESLETCD